MMEAVFLKVVNLSLIASIMVFAVILLRFLFRRAPRWFFCLLWALVALRLIFPFSIESALSLIPSAEPLPVEILTSDNPQIQSGIPAVDNVVNPVLAQTMTPDPGDSANPTQIWSFILSRVWIIGVMGMLGYELISSISLKRKLQTATRYQKGIKQSERVDSPFVFGLIRPMIYLPYRMESEDLPYVIAHEQAHIDRKDHWWKPLGFLLLSVYWFNPILWLAYILLCRDIEAACDEKVVEKMNPEALRGYSTALLHCSIRRRQIVSCPLAFGELAVKERVKNVMNYKKPTFLIIAVSILSCMIVAVCFLTNPKEKNFHENAESLLLTREEADLAGMTESKEELPVYNSFNEVVVKLEAKKQNVSKELSVSLPSEWSLRKDPDAEFEDPDMSCLGTILDEQGQEIGMIGWKESKDFFKEVNILYYQRTVNKRYKGLNQDDTPLKKETAAGNIDVQNDISGGEILFTELNKGLMIAVPNSTFTVEMEVRDEVISRKDFERIGESVTVE